MQPNIFTLNNGLRIILIDTKAFSTITTLLLVGAGSRYEDEENNGIAHFFEHMAFKGSKKYPNSYTISSTIESMGGVFNAFTSKDHTGYWIKATADRFEEVLDVIADMVLEPLLLEEEINREKGVIVEEINMYEDMPARKVSDFYEEILYKGTPLGFDIAGTKKTVNSFTRKTFTDYIDTLYKPNNAVLVVAGGLENITVNKDKKATQIDLMSHYLTVMENKFLNWKMGEKKNYQKITDKNVGPQIAVKYKDTEQSHFCFGFRAFSLRDPRRYALSILSALLGGGMSSRLFIEVRERRGLCYYISTGRELYDDVGNIVTQAGVTNDIASVKEAMKVVWAEHQKVAGGYITDEEVQKAKQFMRGRLLLSLEDSFTVASFYGIRQLLEGMSSTPAEVIQKIESVTKEDIVSVAKEVFTLDRLNITLIGPYHQKDLDITFE